MEKFLAIAFDDGPSEPMCQMVDKLAAYGWKAAFAVLSTAVDGAIGTLHVRKNTCTALDTILPELKRRNFTLVTPEELFRLRGVKNIPQGENIRFVW